MKRSRLNYDARVAAAIYASEVIIFAISLWHFAL
jgi:hypothetical protein